MAETAALRLPRRVSARRGGVSLGGALGGGVVLLWLSVIVLLPLAALTSQAFHDGWSSFWEAATGPQARAALELTLIMSAGAAFVNAIVGTAIAWVLVRDDFRGKRLVEGVIDLPFALPTIVAGLTLLALYGPKEPIGINIAYTRFGVFAALLFVTLPFVVRAVQPVLLDADPDVEAAAASLGAKPRTIARRIVLPILRPAIFSGGALAFARALGEFGAVVLIAGNIPFKTEYVSVFIFGQVESGRPTAAAAVSVILLVISLLVLVALEYFERRAARHAG
jgi:sulfate/thiosulfate transport system permease protein